MKKFLILILICFAQNTFSQNTKTNLKNTSSSTKEKEPVIVKASNYNDSDLVIDEPDTKSKKASTTNDNLIYNACIEVKPDFPGGMEKFYAFVDNNFKKSETDTEVKGKKIYVIFIVEKDGALTEIKVLRDVGYGTGAEAIRVLKKCPKWIPGEHNGKKVRVLYSLPITLK